MPSTRQTTDAPDRNKAVVVSVRFSEAQLEKIQAYAAIFDTTPNAVVREAVEEHLRRRVQSPEFQKASEAHLRRAKLAVEVLAPVGQQPAGRSKNTDTQERIAS
ncbi:hypothetical protein [Kitasatospora sp. NPDC050543]|uniref:hypothetical protein n=1 Tax=Kitasatospora sp. NPDC050543 TaxID=3364054 RepID=UPI0037BB685F